MEQEEKNLASETAEPDNASESTETATAPAGEVAAPVEAAAAPAGPAEAPADVPADTADEAAAPTEAAAAPAEPVGAAPAEAPAEPAEAVPAEPETAPAEDAATATAPADAQGGGAQKGRGPWFVVLVAALVVLVASLIALGVIAFSYFQGQQKYGEIAEQSDFDPRDIDSGLSAATVDWDALRAVNPDIVGWVYVPNTVINYPVVQGQDNDHYLTYDFDGSEGWLAEYGSIFLDFRNNAEWKDQCSFVYGHHMNDGSMFAAIDAMQDQANFDASRTVYLLTPGGNYKLRSFSLVHCDADDPIVETTFATAKDMTEYVQDKIDRSVAKVTDAPAADKMTKIFAFATCDAYSSGRYVLYTYVEDTTAEGLYGEIGLDQNEEGQTTGIDNELVTQE